MTKLTIKEVAKAANVSVASISNYFNDRQHLMGDEVRQRIAETVERLGYTPSRTAQQMRTGRNPLIGLLIPTVANPFFGELAVAIDQAAQDHGLHVVLCNTLQSGARERAFVGDMLSLGAKGVICSSAVVTNDDLQQYEKLGMQVVVIDEKPEKPLPETVDFVTVDHRVSVQLAVEHLVQLGHMRLSYISDGETTFSRMSKAQGFIATARDLGLADAEIVVPPGWDTRARFSDTELTELGQAGAREILRCRPQTTGIVTFNDMTAIGAINEFRDNGISVPGQISVVGIDGINMGRLASPSLTSVHEPLPTLARQAVQCLKRRLEGDRTRARTYLIAPSLRLGGSTTSPPPGDVTNEGDRNLPGLRAQ